MCQEGDSALQEHALCLEGSGHQRQVPGTQSPIIPSSPHPTILRFPEGVGGGGLAHTTSHHPFISSCCRSRWPLSCYCSLFSHSQGDSGAPMVCANWETRRLFQVGVFSWGITSGSRGRPGIFVSVAQFIPWILEETQREGRALALSKASKSLLAGSPRYHPILLSMGSQILLAAIFSDDKSNC